MRFKHFWGPAGPFTMPGEQISRTSVAHWTNGIWAIPTNPKNCNCWSFTAQIEMRIDSRVSTRTTCCFFFLISFFSWYLGLAIISAHDRPSPVFLILYHRGHIPYFSLSFLYLPFLVHTGMPRAPKALLWFPSVQVLGWPLH